MSKPYIETSVAPRAAACIVGSWKYDTEDMDFGALVMGFARGTIAHTAEPSRAEQS